MGSVGANRNTVNTITYEEITGTPIIYGTAAIRPNSIDIDGYSNKKTLKGALSDLAKALEKYDKGEADALRDSIKFGEIGQVKPIEGGGAQYILEYEEVPSAARYNENDEMEYKEAKWYVHTRIIRG